MNLDAWIATIRRGERHLREGDLKKLCRNVHVVQAPVTVCGDIHGQFYDLLTLFKTGGEVEQGHSYIFMGDFVDRGFNSLETFTLLMLLKARWPDRITLLRGNHESRQVTVIYGFWDECNRKYGSPDAWRSCTDVFDCLNIAALVEGRVFCLHGGLSPLARSIDVMRCIQRKQEIPTEGLFCDLMWSDPDEQVDTWSGSPRGAGWLFGQRVTQEFNRINKLSLVCRAHQLVQDGYKYAFSGEELVTVWSAPNYCYRCGNEASILHLDDKLERHFKTFVETAPQYNQVVAQRPSYFL